MAHERGAADGRRLIGSVRQALHPDDEALQPGWGLCRECDGTGERDVYDSSLDLAPAYEEWCGACDGSGAAAWLAERIEAAIHADERAVVAAALEALLAEANAALAEAWDIRNQSSMLRIGSGAALYDAAVRAEGVVSGIERAIAAVAGAGGR